MFSQASDWPYELAFRETDRIAGAVLGTVVAGRKPRRFASRACDCVVLLNLLNKG